MHPLYRFFVVAVAAIAASYSPASCRKLYDVRLPDEHMGPFFRSNPVAAQSCREDASCPYKRHINGTSCWGYEPDCSMQDRYSPTKCPEGSAGWASNKQQQGQLFFNQGDFGFIHERKKTLSILCRPHAPGASLLECVRHMELCRAKNIRLDFQRLLHMNGPVKAFAEGVNCLLLMQWTHEKKTQFNVLIHPPHANFMYREDILGRGLVGGHCQLDRDSLRLEGDHKSPLQSWFAELEHFEELPEQVADGDGCDVILDRPTVVMKLDAIGNKAVRFQSFAIPVCEHAGCNDPTASYKAQYTNVSSKLKDLHVMLQEEPKGITAAYQVVNMYHHFCDFLNLYLTLHFNGSLAGDFDVLIWDTVPYRGTFLPMWSAFHQGQLRSLSEFKGKKVCLREALFSFLPRMIFGMYYNLPLVPGCHASGLFKAFNRHVLHRLGIKVQPPEGNVRVTMLSRGTKHRRVLNEDELLAATRKLPGVSVQRVQFNHGTELRHQIEVMANTDILIGMHGAGLTHVLFQPDWAVLFEIFNCEDPVCYKDLARLRGVKYITWEDSAKLRPEDKGHHPTLGAHAKFTNYHFDVDEFIRLLGKAIDHVRNACPSVVVTASSDSSRKERTHDEM